MHCSKTREAVLKGAGRQRPGAFRTIRAVQAFHSDHFVLPLPEGHRFPMLKYRMLRDRVAAVLALLLMAARPLPTAASEMSTITTWMPDTAHACAMPLPNLLLMAWATLRAAWKSALVEAHPDRARARGLPDEYVAVAESKAAAINAAFDAAMRERRGIAPV